MTRRPRCLKASPAPVGRVGNHVGLGNAPGRGSDHEFFCLDPLCVPRAGGPVVRKGLHAGTKGTEKCLSARGSQTSPELTGWLALRSHNTTFSCTLLGVCLGLVQVVGVQQLVTQVPCAPRMGQETPRAPQEQLAQTTRCTDKEIEARECLR